MNTYLSVEIYPKTYIFLHIFNRQSTITVHESKKNRRHFWYSMSIIPLFRTLLQPLFSGSQPLLKVVRVSIAIISLYLG